MQNLPLFKCNVLQFKLAYLEKLPLMLAGNCSRKVDTYPNVRCFTFIYYYYFLVVSVLGSWLHITVLQDKV